MARHLTVLAILGATSFTGLNSNIAYADEFSVNEQNLVAALDRAFRPGIMDTNGKRKNADGTYSRSVTTGDAIARSTIAAPLETLKAACTASGGKLDLRLSAGRVTGDQAVALEIGGEHLSLNRAELWSWFTITSHYADTTAQLGFAPLFSTSPFANRATSAADAEPPFGLFACRSSQGPALWAAAIMPVGGPTAYDLAVKVTPVTSSWIRTHNAEVESARLAADRAVRETDERQAAAIAHGRAEEARLRPFRAALKIGSRTNCGIVIAVRNPLLQVQLPPNVLGPGGTREFWVPRDQLTDDYPPNGCRFGG
jgi:hypothetical protein